MVTAGRGRRGAKSRWGRISHRLGSLPSSRLLHAMVVGQRHGAHLQQIANPGHDVDLLRRRLEATGSRGADPQRWRLEAPGAAEDGPARGGSAPANTRGEGARRRPLHPSPRAGCADSGLDRSVLDLKGVCSTDRQIEPLQSSCFYQPGRALFAVPSLFMDKDEYKN
nr:uncharacterized protein LOC127302402 isoform X2 [Lolium perenne]